MYSVDMLYKEEDCIEGRHLKSDFCQPVHFMREIKERWPPEEYQFPVIFMDWFFEVDGYSQDHLKTNFIKRLIPELAREYKVEAVWLPWTTKVDELWCEDGTSKSCADVGLRAVAVKNAAKNPFYCSTVTVQGIFNHGVPPIFQKWADEELQKARSKQHPFMYWLCLQKDESRYGV